MCFKIMKLKRVIKFACQIIVKYNSNDLPFLVLFYFLFLSMLYLNEIKLAFWRRKLGFWITSLAYNMLLVVLFVVEERVD